jgi:tripartite ATP-independent transporter DctM subunit
LEWQFVLPVIFGSLLILMASGMPVAFSFILISIVGMYVFFGGAAGLEQLIISINTSLTTFVLLPVPLFIFMGELMFHSGMAPLLVETLDKWLGRLPGRLSLLAVSAGTLFATLTGTSMASTAMLGSILVPEMENRGYKKPMSLGPILGSGGLAIMIPPSGLAVLLGAIGEISIGKILIAIIIPGLLMAIFYAAYIIIRCWLQPSIAPAYEVSHTPLSKKLSATVRYILPLGLVIFLVIGVIFLGVATPSEAAATGTIGTAILAFFNGRLTWGVIKKAIGSTLAVVGMVLLIISGATALAQILAYSGATQGLCNLATGLPLAPTIIVIAMQIIILFLGCLMDVVAIMMITIPIFVPVVVTLNFNTVWFATIFLLNIEMAGTTPPFGMGLMVMKGVAPPETTMGDIYLAALPFLGCNLIVMVLMIAFPKIALWLPGLMF